MWMMDSTFTADWQPDRGRWIFAFKVLVTITNTQQGPPKGSYDFQYMGCIEIDAFGLGINHKVHDFPNARYGLKLGGFMLLTPVNAAPSAACRS
jgi:hypothetical protein